MGLVWGHEAQDKGRQCGADLCRTGEPVRGEHVRRALAPRALDQVPVVLVEPLAAPHQQLMGNGPNEALNHRQMHVIVRQFKHLAGIAKQGTRARA